MLKLTRPHCRRLALIAAAILASGLGVVSTAAPARAATTFQPALQCPPEQTPTAGAPRSAAYTPYQVPFNAELGVAYNPATKGPDGGYIIVNGSNGPNAPGSPTGGALSVVLGPKNAQYTTGTLFGNACGYFSIPSLLGNIPEGTGAEPANPLYNHNFILHGPPFLATQDLFTQRPGQPPAYTPTGAQQQILATPIPVAIEVPGTGVPMVMLSGSGSSDSDIPNAIATTPAANGGLNVSFDTSAKSTAFLSAAIMKSLLPSQASNLIPQSLLDALNSLLNQTANGNGPAECTLTIGNTNLTGYPSNHVGPFVNPVHVSTDVNSSPTAKAAGATPVTGPINNATGIAVSTGIIQPPIDPDTQPDVGAPGAGTTPPSTLCNPLVAQLLNGMFGLPQAGSGQVKAADTFVAPVTFEAYASK